MDRVRPFYSSAKNISRPRWNHHAFILATLLAGFILVACGSSESAPTGTEIDRKVVSYAPIADVWTGEGVYGDNDIPWDMDRMEVEEKAKVQEQVGTAAWSDAQDSCTGVLKAKGAKTSGTTDTFNVILQGNDGCNEVFPLRLIHTSQDTLLLEATNGGDVYSTATLWRKE